VIDVVLGVMAGNHLKGDPVWLYLIGPPSSGKTELLFSLQECPEAYFLSDLTTVSLISGYRDPPAKTNSPKVSGGGGRKKKSKDRKKAPKGKAAETKPEKDYSLLPELDGKVVVTKDMSVIHSKPADARTQILGQLRDAYDGFSSRKVGSADTKGYHSRFNYLAGMTPQIETNWSMNTLGERFLMYRMRIDDRREHARAALDGLRSGGGTEAVRQELQNAVKDFLEGLKVKMAGLEPEVDDQTAEKIIDLAELLSTFRTYVYRDRNGEAPCQPQAELASRVAKQLMRIGQGVALVRARKAVTDEEFSVMKRVALDSLPTNRRRLLAALWAQGRDWASLDVFTQQLSLASRTTVTRELKNLAALGAVETEKEGTKDTFRLSETYYQYCQNVGGVHPPLKLTESCPADGKGVRQ
jgi:hypothetical protein